MNYGTLSPNECAAEILAKILEILPQSAEAQEKIAGLIRQKVRLIIEECAMIAEDYILDHDPDEKMTGQAVADGIAECLRTMADDREADRILVNLRIARD